MRRLLVLLSVLSLLFPAAVSAEEPTGADRWEQAPTQGTVDTDLVPLSIDDDRQVTVMLEMRGDPVAVVKGRAPDKQITEEHKGQIKRDLRAQQDAIVDDIAAAGGQVRGQYQVAYNGIKVRIARNQVAALAALPNVIAVRAIELHTPGNHNSVPWIGAPQVWEDFGLTGDGIKIGIIDTGIDYTHANFGGPGTVEAYEAADAADTEPADPALFGPEALTKVKGGFDFAGDDYDASDPELDTPAPDPNPLDCNGHGSHVAGSAAGFGVLADGSTYAGPYDESTHDSSFRVGPGVAPEAELYALRVFGCLGSTDVTVDAIEWAVDNEMDVINMSLGSTFGRPDDPSAVASNNAADSGVVVVTSAGNSGAQQYIGGSPGVGTRTIAVAAQDTIQTTPGVSLALTDASGASLGSILAQNSNDAAVTDGTSLEVVVLRNEDGSVSLGCDPQEYIDADVQGKLVVTLRGSCARVARAIFGEQAGAAAVAMLNTDSGYPPFEGPITSNPDTGEDFTVTIPFLGVRGVLGPGAQTDPDTLVAADGGNATLTNAAITNPNFQRFAGFSSNGPRRIDHWLKPDITAPGVSIQSTLVASGNGGTRISGTSMAAPHVAGVAALMVQARPGWSVEDIKAAIVNTGDPSRIPTTGSNPFRISRGGSGLVQPALATQTDAVAIGNPGTASLSFGYRELTSNFTGTLPLTVRNHGAAPVTFNLGTAMPFGSAHTVVFTTPEGAPATSVVIPAGGSTAINVTLNVPAATVGSATAYRESAGFVTLSPVAGGNDGISLRVPYYMVPRASANVRTTVNSAVVQPDSDVPVTVTNAGGTRAGDADFYQWGLEDRNEGLDQNDLRAVGVQSADAVATFGAPVVGGRNIEGEQFIVFAVNTWTQWQNNAVDEYDILIDIDEDDVWDYAVVGVDIGVVTTGLFNGQMGAWAFNLETGTAEVFFLASYRFNNGTTLLPIFSEMIGLSEENPDFRYTAAAFTLRDGIGNDVINQKAGYNAWDPAISGDFVVVPAGGSVPSTVHVGTSAQIDAQHLRGVMIVSADNAAGAAETQLIRMPGRVR